MKSKYGLSSRFLFTCSKDRVPAIGKRSDPVGPEYDEYNRKKAVGTIGSLMSESAAGELKR